MKYSGAGILLFNLLQSSGVHGDGHEFSMDFKAKADKEFKKTKADKEPKADKEAKSGKGNKYDDVLDIVSPQTTYPNVPEQCRGKVPDMLGEYRFFGFRFEGFGMEPQLPADLTSWTEGTNLIDIAGIEWVPWVDGPYYMLAINSPAGLVRRFCTFDARDNRTSVCTGMDDRDETLTELLYVTETDALCRAESFSIITTKAWTNGTVVNGTEAAGPGETKIANMFVDKVQGVRESFWYPEYPSDVV